MTGNAIPSHRVACQTEQAEPYYAYRLYYGGSIHEFPLSDICHVAILIAVELSDISNLSYDTLACATSSVSPFPFPLQTRTLTRSIGSIRRTTPHPVSVLILAYPVHSHSPYTPTSPLTGTLASNGTAGAHIPGAA